MSFPAAPTNTSSPVGLTQTTPGTGATATAQATMGASEEGFITGFTYQTCSGATLTFTYQDKDGNDLTLSFTPADDLMQIVEGLKWRIKAGGTAGVVTSGGASGSKVTINWYKYAAALRSGPYNT